MELQVCPDCGSSIEEVERVVGIGGSVTVLSCEECPWSCLEGEVLYGWL